MVAVNVDREASRIGLGLTAAASLLAALVAAPGSVGLSLVGVPLAVGGVYRLSRRLLGVGVAALFVGVVLAGVSGLAPGPVVLAMLGVVLTWDLGEHAIGSAEQLRESADSERVEVIHAAASGLVASFFGLGGYIVFLLSAGGQPEIALGLLLLGAVVALTALR